MRMKFFASTLCALLAVALFGCSTETKTGTTSTTKPGETSSSGGKKRFIFLSNGDDPYWDTCNAGFQEGAKQFELDNKGIKAEFQKNSGGSEGQINRLRQYATEPDIVGLAISVVQADNKGIAKEMENLKANGVKVITVDGDINQEKFKDARTYYIGTNNFSAGQQLGTAAKAILESKGLKSGGYAQFAGYRDNDNARSRMNGVQDAIGKEFKELDRMPDEMKRDRAHDNVRSALDKFAGDDLVALVGIWAYNGPAIATVVSERKARDKFVVLTFDAAQDSIAEMAKNNIDAMVVQNPFEMGTRAIELLLAMHSGDEATVKRMFPKDAGEPGADVFTTGLRVVVPDEGSPLKADMFPAEGVEFLELGKFKEWLNKYGLKSS